MQASQNNSVWFVAILWPACSLHPCWLTVRLLSVGTVADKTGSKEKSWSDPTDLHIPILCHCLISSRKNNILTEPQHGMGVSYCVSKLVEICMCWTSVSLCLSLSFTDFYENWKDLTYIYSTNVTCKCFVPLHPELFDVLLREETPHKGLQ